MNNDTTELSSTLELLAQATTVNGKIIMPSGSLSHQCYDAGQIVRLAKQAVNAQCQCECGNKADANLSELNGEPICKACVCEENEGIDAMQGAA